MRSDRRSFLVLSSIASAGVFADRALGGQDRQRKPFPSPPESAGPSETKSTQPGAAAPKVDSGKQRESAFRDRVHQLFEMTRDLKEKVDKTQTSQIFSVDIYKRTNEIEKLAKQVKGLAKS